jgi:hypothetical protein
MMINKKKINAGYHYKVFGLHVSSDILLPELVAIDTSDMPEVNIRLGKVHEDVIINLNSDINKNEMYRAVKNEFSLIVSGVASYYVTNGNSITVEPAEQSKETSVRLFLLGTAFGALLMQRGILPFHGSAVVINGCCVIFTGTSGAGKSTLLTAFIKKGYLFLTDDVAAVTMDNEGVFWVHPAYPQQKLWRDSAETMKIDITGLTPFYSYNSSEKFAVPALKSFCQAPAPLAAVYELEVGIGVEKQCSTNIRRLENIDKLAVIISHTYRPWLIDKLGLKEAHFKQCVAVARQVAVSRLTRPEGIIFVEEQANHILQDLESLVKNGIK